MINVKILVEYFNCTKKARSGVYFNSNRNHKHSPENSQMKESFKVITTSRKKYQILIFQDPNLEKN
jgi:hypothetical protein